MRIELDGKRRILIGAAAAAVIGLGLGAWLKPSLAESPAPDPYANLVITAPTAEQASAVEQVAWDSYPTQWMGAPARDVWSTAAVPVAASVEPVSWSPPPDLDGVPDSLPKADVDQALPPPDNLDQGSPAAEPVRQIAEAQPAAKLQPGDWDVPGSAYEHAAFQAVAAK